MAFQPILALAFVQNNFQRAKAKRNEGNSDVVDLELAAGPRCLGFFNKLRRIRNEPVSKNQTDQPDGHVDEKYPAPGEVVCDPAAKGWPDSWRCHDGHAVKRERGGALGAGKSVYQDG